MESPSRAPAAAPHAARFCTPREVAVRSKVAPQSGPRSARATGGGGHLPCIDVELVRAPEARKTPRNRAVQAKVLPTAGGQKMDSARGGGRQDRFRLSAECRQDLKVRLENLTSTCRADFAAHPRTLRYFLKELHEVCVLAGVNLASHSYRSKYTSLMLHHLVQLTPTLSAGAEPPPAGEDLPLHEFLPLTVLLALSEVSWEFQYNSLQHRVCNCASLLPEAGGACVVPADELRPGKAWSPRTESLHVREFQAKVEDLRRRERHFPTKLPEASAALRSCFQDLTRRLPDLREDFLNVQDQTSTGTPHGASGSVSDRFVVHVLSELTAFDHYYTQFEKLYLALVHRVMGSAVEPLRDLQAPSSTIMKGPSDPFGDVQTAVLCQRLGLMKQQVDFGGAYNVRHFDPRLLAKARRVLHMHTHKEVHELAAQLLARFDALCKILVGINSEQIKPELRENAELRTAVTELEAVWGECQFLLEQDVLDFIHDLCGFLAKLRPYSRWQLGLVMRDESSTDPVQATREEQKVAQVFFFETLPILMYVEEMWLELSQEKEDSQHAPSSTTRQSFRQIFCPKEDWHRRVRLDFARVILQRYTKFVEFLLDGACEDPFDDEEENNTESQYFRLTYHKLRDIAAFPTEKSPAQALCAATSSSFVGSERKCGPEASAQDRHDLEQRLRQEARREAQARWICVHRTARLVQPHLFPTQRPAGSLLQAAAKGRRAPGDFQAGSALRTATVLKTITVGTQAVQRISSIMGRPGNQHPRRTETLMAGQRRSRRE